MAALAVAAATGAAATVPVALVAAADAGFTAAEIAGAVLDDFAAAGVLLTGAAAVAADRPSSSPSPCRCPSWSRPPPAWRSAANKSCKNDSKSAPREFDAVPLELDEAELDALELEALALEALALEALELDVLAAVVAIGVAAAVAAEVALDALVGAAAVAEFSVTN